MPEITTQVLLDAAREAYLSALKSVSLTHGDRTKINQQIDKLSAEVQRLEAKLVNEHTAALGSFGPKVLLADLSGRNCR